LFYYSEIGTAIAAKIVILVLDENITVCDPGSEVDSGDDNADDDCYKEENVE
jgi:hypothetical protein